MKYRSRSTDHLCPYLVHSINPILIEKDFFSLGCNVHLNKARRSRHWWEIWIAFSCSFTNIYFFLQTVKKQEAIRQVNLDIEHAGRIQTVSNVIGQVRIVELARGIRILTLLNISIERTVGSSKMIEGSQGNGEDFISDSSFKPKPNIRDITDVSLCILYQLVFNNHYLNRNIECSIFTPTRSRIFMLS